MKNTIVEKHFDKVADTYDKGKRRYSYYYSSLKKLLRRLIGKNKKVFEFGCGTGDLLVSLKPRFGYGMDISSKMIKMARKKHSDKKNITFSTSMPKEKFDYIFLSDVVEHLDDHISTFKELVRVMNDDTKIIVTMANPIWEPLLMVWEALGLKMKEGKHKRVSFRELKIIMKSLGLKVVEHDYKLLLPIEIPLITSFANKYLEKLFKPLCFVEYFIITKSQ